MESVKFGTPAGCNFPPNSDVTFSQLVICFLVLAAWIAAIFILAGIFALKKRFISWMGYEHTPNRSDPVAA